MSDFKTTHKNYFKYRLYFILKQIIFLFALSRWVTGQINMDMDNHLKLIV